EDRMAAIRDVVREQAARVLRIAEAKLDADVSFTRLGMDSLTGLELRNRLGEALQLQLPATLIFQHTTIAAVADYLVDAFLRAKLSFAAAEPIAAATAPLAGAGVGIEDEEE